MYAVNPPLAYRLIRHPETHHPLIIDRELNPLYVRSVPRKIDPNVVLDSVDTPPHVYVPVLVAARSHVREVPQSDWDHGRRRRLSYQGVATHEGGPETHGYFFYFEEELEGCWV